MYVRLVKAWTDRRGVRHPAGAFVDVDPATLAELEADGTVERRHPPSDGSGSDGFPDPSAEPPASGRPPGTDFDDDR